MGFNNGYDSGYADAIEDVHSGRVAGLGPVSEKHQGDQSSPQTLTFNDMLDTLHENISNLVAEYTTVEAAEAASEKAADISTALGGRAFELTPPSSDDVG